MTCDSSCLPRTDCIALSVTWFFDESQHFTSAIFRCSIKMSGAVFCINLVKKGAVEKGDLLSLI